MSGFIVLETKDTSVGERVALIKPDEAGVDARAAPRHFFFAAS
jgi:hypothetical protein